MIDCKNDCQLQYLRLRGADHDTRSEPGPRATGDEELLVHNWRVARLTQLGIPGALAEVDADHLDWHQVARLVQLGCPPRLALRIVH